MVLCYAAGAYADPIGPNCDSCNGGIYTLTFSGNPISNDDTNSTSTYRVTLTIDTTDPSFTAGPSFPPAAVDAAAIKVSSSVESATLFPAAGWTISSGGINAGGCSGHGLGFECAGKSGGLAIANSLSWTFDLVIADSVGLNVTPSIKVRYVDDEGKKTGSLVSEHINLQAVPEPSALLLLASGVAVLAARRRRKA